MLQTKSVKYGQVTVIDHRWYTASRNISVRFGYNYYTPKADNRTRLPIMATEQFAALPLQDGKIIPERLKTIIKSLN